MMPVGYPISKYPEKYRDPQTRKLTANIRKADVVRLPDSGETVGIHDKRATRIRAIIFNPNAARNSDD